MLAGEKSASDVELAGLAEATQLTYANSSRNDARRAFYILLEPTLVDAYERPDARFYDCVIPVVAGEAFHEPLSPAKLGAGRPRVL